MAMTDDAAMVEEEYQGKPLDQLKTMFRSAEETHQPARELSRRDVDWYDNFSDSQWSDEEKRVLRDRGQPVVTSNRIKRKVNFLLGYEQRGRTDPKAYPRNPQDENAAKVATDVLDYIEHQSRFDREASNAFKDMCLMGIEAAEVVIDPETSDIKASRIDGFKVYYDPRSREGDFSDARYIGYSDWHDLEEAVELFPEAQEELEASVDSSVADDDYDDKPESLWCSPERQRVRIAVCYYKHQGQWCYAYHTGSAILEEGVSLYLDEKGQPACPIIAQSAYVTRDNERYGVVRDMIGPQSETNYRRSMSLFLLKSKRMWARQGVFQSPQKAKQEAAKANGLVMAEGTFGQDWGFLGNEAETSGNFELLQEAKAELDIQGPNAGLQGRGVEGQSGRAIIAQQNAGLAEENALFDAHNDFKLRCYQAMWARAKQFWTEEKYIRVTDDEQAFRFMHVNVFAGIDPMTGQPIVQNALAQMDVDIIIDTAPDTISLQHEQFEQLSQMAQAGLPIPPDILIMASQLTDKQQILERLQQAQQNPMAQAEMQIKMAGEQADVEETQAKTEKYRAETIKTKAETIGTAVDAAQKTGDMMTPRAPDPGQPLDQMRTSNGPMPPPGFGR